MRKEDVQIGKIYMIKGKVISISNKLTYIHLGHKVIGVHHSELIEINEDDE